MRKKKKYEQSQSSLKLTKMKHIAIFRLIQWFTGVCYSKIKDLFFSLFFLNIFLLLLVQKNIWYEFSKQCLNCLYLMREEESIT